MGACCWSYWAGTTMADVAEGSTGEDKADTHRSTLEVVNQC